MNGTCRTYEKSKKILFFFFKKYDKLTTGNTLTDANNAKLDL